jgi:dUTP pyrophosphatase
MEIIIKKLKDKALVPEYQTVGAAAFDLHACLDEPIVLQPLERAVVPTGIAVEIPLGYELQVRARSGMSIKHGLTMVNGIGTVDSDYRGEVGMLVINLGQEPYEIVDGERIAQGVVAKYEQVTFTESSELSSTERGERGYGSTGHN